MLIGRVTNIRSVDDIYDEFGDIGRVVLDTLNSLCGKQVVKANRDGPWVFHHVGREFSCKGKKLLVDDMVILDNLCCCDGVSGRLTQLCNGPLGDRVWMLFPLGNLCSDRQPLIDACHCRRCSPSASLRRTGKIPNCSPNSKYPSRYRHRKKYSHHLH
jgi:hypothetical protein